MKETAVALRAASNEIAARTPIFVLDTLFLEAALSTRVFLELFILIKVTKVPVAARLRSCGRGTEDLNRHVTKTLCAECVQS